MTTTTAGPAPITDFEKRVGHPPGLFLLFFAEMWERFSYYGMRALLVLYMTKGFLSLNDNAAYTIYGAYTSLVYMTPFFGGMIADRILGARRAVILGGALMAAGHLLMTIESEIPFFFALALLICGNGFFKPNISTIVGSLYGAHNKEKRDGGFTIFYMGINLGAALAPLLCGYVGEKYGWHFGFGLATIGMLVGLAIFVAPTLLTQAAIAITALASAVALIFISMGQGWAIAVSNYPMAVALAISAGLAVYALMFGGLPLASGAPPSIDGLRKNQWKVLVGVVVAIPAAAALVRWNGVVGLLLTAVGLAAFGFTLVEAARSKKVERDRLIVLLIMYFFSMLFWAFFEQAGSSMNLFTDRNVDRVTEMKHVEASDVGKTIEFEVNQEQLGYDHDGKLFTLEQLDAARKEGKTKQSWMITDKHVGMGIEGSEVPASVFQAANPEFILIFGLVFSSLWVFLARRKIEPSTPAKFAFGLVQLSLGFVALWYGAQHADQRGMVGATWLLLAYLLHTTGELCLSPVGLSMVTKLSPKRLVSTMMGGWFLATAFSEYLAGLIATLTGVHGHGGDENVIPPPIATVNIYGDVFGRIAIASAVAAVLLFALTPLIKKMMHMDQPMTGEDDEEAPRH